MYFININKGKWTSWSSTKYLVLVAVLSLPDADDINCIQPSTAHCLGWHWKMLRFRIILYLPCSPCIWVQLQASTVRFISKHLKLALTGSKNNGVLRSDGNISILDSNKSTAALVPVPGRAVSRPSRNFTVRVGDPYYGLLLVENTY